MSRAEIVARGKRGGSFDRDISPWKSDFSAMARKTVLKALLAGGTVPLSAEARHAIVEDDVAVDDEPAGSAHVTQPTEDPPQDAKPAAGAQQKLRNALGLKGPVAAPGGDGGGNEGGEENPFGDDA